MEVYIVEMYVMGRLDCVAGIFSSQQLAEEAKGELEEYYNSMCSFTVRGVYIIDTLAVYSMRK